jgi:GNAT superfamily N-acetyltransferase
VSRTDTIEIVDVTDMAAFDLLPPCADPRYDHRSCDYWEDGVRGSKAARASWWQPRTAPAAPRQVPRSDNPFAPPPRATDDFNPFAPAPGGSVPLDTDDLPGAPDFNPFAPRPEIDGRAANADASPKLRLLDRGRPLPGSYAKVLLRFGEPTVYAQFGPLSAYPRASQIRELYPRLPSAPLPAVITCVATIGSARGHGLARMLVTAIADDLATRGFAAIEAYPDLTLQPDEASAASPAFWVSCGFVEAVTDERYPVLRLDL